MKSISEMWDNTKQPNISVEMREGIKKYLAIMFSITASILHYSGGCCPCNQARTSTIMKSISEMWDNTKQPNISVEMREGIKKYLAIMFIITASILHYSGGCCPCNQARREMQREFEEKK